MLETTGNKSSTDSFVSFSRRLVKPSYVRPLDKGTGEAVAKRTVFRATDNNDWGSVAIRVAEGNCSLHESGANDLQAMTDAIASGSLLMSGRHLQHGDETQKSRAIEVFTNCSTSATSFGLFYLLLNGSGVGRSYDDQMMALDWTKAPQLKLALDPEHADFPKTQEDLEAMAREWYIPVEQAWALRDEWAANFASLNEKQEKTVYQDVEDSREGWGWSVEQWEAMAFNGQHDWTLVLNWTPVRKKNSPIGGMQSRPASGPLSPMRALWRIMQNVVGSSMSRWKAAMHVDHYLSEEVQVGGARRAARMSTKDWRDPEVIDFIHIKSKGGLWSSNNSVMVDQDFWNQVDMGNERAVGIFRAAIECSYHNGEPGFINGDMLEAHGLRHIYTDGRDFRSDRFHARVAQDMMAECGRRAAGCRFKHITNPCVAGDSWVSTANGLRKPTALLGQQFVSTFRHEKLPSTVKGFWSNGVKPTVWVSTEAGYRVRVTKDHRFRLTNGSDICASDLKPGDQLLFGGGYEPEDIDHESLSFKKGWLLGELVGNGGEPSSEGYGYVRFWGPHAEGMASYAAKCCNEVFGTNLNVERNSGNGVYTVSTVALSSLCTEYLTAGKQITDKVISAEPEFVAGFLSGFFDADGSVQGSLEKGTSIRLSQSDEDRLRAVQTMLAGFGIMSSLYLERRPPGYRTMPDGKGGSAEYLCKSEHELIISRQSMDRFMRVATLKQPEKRHAWQCIVSARTRAPYKDPNGVAVESITEAEPVEVYDCSIPGMNLFSANGLAVHNCGEISLSVLGGYCVIADVSPAHAFNGELEEAIDIRKKLYLASENYHPAFDSWDQSFIEAAQMAARALIRVNLMPALYQEEVKRTNRVGVGLTGIHEYAWLRWGLTFRDMLSGSKEAYAFWSFLNRVSNAVKAEAARYARQLGVEVPHTITTIKPAGTTSKLFGVTEGAHLPSMNYYLRWVQFKGQKVDGEWLDADPLLAKYEAKGYPIRCLSQQYRNVAIVGFPAMLLISRIGMPEVVTAHEATPDEQYEWIRLLEKHWIGTEEGQGNQVSYTLKIMTDKVSLSEYIEIVLRNQRTVRCCSVMPQKPAHLMGFEYLPEEEVSLDRFVEVVGNINDPELVQDIDMNTLLCSTGACPM
jgi:hypothetical protein